MKLISKAFLLVAALAILPVSVQAADKDVQTTLNGMTLNAHLSLAEGKTLADGVVLITHGTLAHNKMEITKALQTAFKEREVNSLSINLSFSINDRKSAMLDCTIDHKHKHTDAMDEIATWVGWLKKNGASRIVISGHSRGGYQTAWYAAERMDPAITHVALIAPGGSSGAPGNAGYVRTHNQQLHTLLEKAKNLAAAGKGDELLNKVGLLYCKDTNVSAASFVSYYDPAVLKNTKALLPMIKAPTIIIAGSEDNVVRGLIPAVKPMVTDKLKLIVVEGAGHFFRDLYLEDVADGIVEFIGAGS